MNTSQIPQTLRITPKTTAYMDSNDPVASVDVEEVVNEIALDLEHSHNDSATAFDHIRTSAFIPDARHGLRSGGEAAQEDSDGHFLDSRSLDLEFSSASADREADKQLGEQDDHNKTGCGQGHTPIQRAQADSPSPPFQGVLDLFSLAVLQRELVHYRSI
ncbi:hypothetical protein C8Q76DRAFT_793353 [Earliella scabrosa]|nr:hypothetical protein C8Q76DRAFT_793353 [Earliella scabrosa]